MDPWRLIQAPQTSGAVNMAADLELFGRCEKGEELSVLRLYSWQPKCISYGYSQRIEELIDCQKEQKDGWQIVRRPTGGGIVYHHEGEISYSVITSLDNPRLPKGLIPSYLMISEIIIMALKTLGVEAQIQGSRFQIQNKSQTIDPGSKNHLCFRIAADHEIVANGRKIVGSAQKRGRRAILQQGTVKLSNINFIETSSAIRKSVENLLSARFELG
jgi:lipoate-protein ligase A